MSATYVLTPRELAIEARNREMADLRARNFHVDPFGNAVQPKDREARPRLITDYLGDERVEIPMNHPCCRVLNHDLQYSIFDLYRFTGASASKWMHAATAGSARMWLAARARRLEIPIWQALADLGAPIEVALAARSWGANSGLIEAEAHAVEEEVAS